VDEVAYLAVLGVVAARPPERDQPDRQPVRGVAEQDGIQRAFAERPQAAADDRRDGQEHDGGARGIHHRAGNQRKPRRPLVGRRVARRPQLRHQDGGDGPDGEDEPRAAVDEQRPDGRRSRQADRRRQPRRQDAHHGDDDDEQRRQHEQDDEQLRQQLEEVAGALSRPRLPVGEHPRLHPEVADQRLGSLTGVFAELQQERRQRLPGRGLPGDAAEPGVETPRQRGLPEDALEGGARLAVGVLSGHLPEHLVVVVAAVG